MSEGAVAASTRVRARQCRTAQPRYDVAIIGGGPAGTSAASLLARRDRSVLLLERSRFPRFQIGESLIPETNQLLEEIGVAEKVRAAGFVAKRGAFFISPSGRHEVHIDFREGRDISPLGTWQVSRDRFDQILFDHARSCGVDARTGCHVSGVEFGDDGASITWREGSDQRTEMRPKKRTQAQTAFVIDASGRSGLLAKRFGLRDLDPALANVSLHARFEGVVPPPADRAGDLRVVSLDPLGWAWLIPLSESVTSVGVVVPKIARRGETAEDDFVSFLDSSDALRAFLRKARRCEPVRIDADFSYSVKRYVGDRWMLAGDAGSFIDPIFSTGVLLALRSGVEAGRALDRALGKSSNGRRLTAVIDPAPLAHYQRRQRRAYRFFRRFVVSFYRPEFRDLLLQPTARFGVVRAIVTALAGKTDLVWSDRLRLRAFFALVAAHRRWGLVDRIHNPRKGELNYGSREALS